MDNLSLNGRTFSINHLKPGATAAELASLTAYELDVLRFCRQWLAGQQAFSLPTSGSTGKPKTIRLNRKQMQLSAHLTGQALGLRPGDKALVCLSTQYIAGMMMLVRGFELGLELTIIDPTSNPLLSFDDAAHFDFTALVPLQFQTILTETPQKEAILNRMKGILVGGAPVSEALSVQLQSLRTPIYHTYAMTETVSHVALRRLNGPEASDTFHPLPGVELGLDPRGCLTIRAGVTNGQTLQTNDLVELKADGAFKWLGRIDNVINSGGVKVQVERVETVLDRVLYHYRAGLFAQRRFFVGSVDHPRLGQAVTTIIEGQPFSTEVEAEIRAELSQSLSKYEIPRHFYFTDRLLETPTGKIDRQANLLFLTQQPKINKT